MIKKQFEILSNSKILFKIYLQKKVLICGPPILQTGNFSKKTNKKKFSAV